MRKASPRGKSSEVAEVTAVRPDAEPVDHRVRTGAARREATRQKLLAAAVQVFATKGADTPLIDDFIAAAGVARGTFYNYFNTTSELLDAVTAELSDQVMANIDAHIRQIESPIERVGTGCLLYMHIAVTHPSWGSFIVQTGIRGGASGKLLGQYLPRDLENANAKGQAKIPNIRAARDVVIGSLRQGIQSVVSGTEEPAHIREILRFVLSALRVKEAQIKELCAKEPPYIPLPVGIMSLEEAAHQKGSSRKGK